MLQEALEELQPGTETPHPPQVLCCPGLSTPCGIGLVRRKILLPSREYAADELRHILRHELQHFQTHDLLVTWMIRVFQCLFWWNPLVYLLGRDLDQVLEIKCDLSVTKGYGKKETVAYMRTIKHQLEQTIDREKTVPLTSASLVGNFAISNVEERFLYLAESLKPTQRKARRNRPLRSCSRRSSWRPIRLFYSRAILRRSSMKTGRRSNTWRSRILN